MSKGMGKFVLGTTLGVGLGLLFAPKKGSETRKELGVKLQELLEQIKNIDTDEVKDEFTKKINNIKEELQDLDKEKALKLAKKKSEELQKQAEDLVDLAVAKGTPVLKKAAEEVLQKTIQVSKNVLSRLDSTEENK